MRWLLNSHSSLAKKDSHVTNSLYPRMAIRKLILNQCSAWLRNVCLLKLYWLQKFWERNHIFLLWHLAFREWELGNHEHDFSRLWVGGRNTCKSSDKGDGRLISFLPARWRNAKGKQSCWVGDEPMDGSMPWPVSQTASSSRKCIKLTVSGGPRISASKYIKCKWSNVSHPLDQVCSGVKTGGC